MAWPTTNIVTTEMDAATDTPPRDQILAMAQTINSILAERAASNGIPSLVSGKIPVAQIPSLNAGQTTGGVFGLGLIPTIPLGGSDVSGVLPASKIPDATITAQGVVQLGNLVTDFSTTKAPTMKLLNDSRNAAQDKFATVSMVGSGSNRKWTLGNSEGEVLQIIVGTYTHTGGDNTAQAIAFHNNGFGSSCSMVIADLAQNPSSSGIGINAYDWNLSGFSSRRNHMDNSSSSASMTCSYIAIGRS